MKSLRNYSAFRLSFLAGALAVGTVASTGAAFAQTGSTMLLQADIPFSFEDGNHHMPAGQYVIRKASDHVLWLKGPGHTTDFVMVNDSSSVNPATKSVVVFRRSGNRYFLKSISAKGSTEGIQCPKGRAEKEYLRAASEPQPSTVELAANLIPTR